MFTLASNPTRKYCANTLRNPSKLTVQRSSSQEKDNFYSTEVQRCFKAYCFHVLSYSMFCQLGWRNCAKNYHSERVMFCLCVNVSAFTVNICTRLMTKFGSQFRNILHPVNAFTDSQTRCLEYPPWVTSLHFLAKICFSTFAPLVRVFLPICFLSTPELGKCHFL